MGNRISSEHSSITTLRATVVRRGRTRRPELRLSSTAIQDLPTGEVIRLVIDEEEKFAPVESRGDGVGILGAYDTPERAREPAGAENRLLEWLDTVGISFGQSVLVDVVVPVFRYGVREPGSTAIYDARKPPSQSLQSIAKNLESDTR